MLCKNVYVDVKEIFHPVSGVKRTVRLCTPSSDNLFSAFKHNSLRLVLRNGEVWVIDITGSQYGWTEICTPWDDYKKAKISTAGKTDEDPFGSSHSHMATLAFPQCKHPVLGMIRFSQQHLAEHFHRLVRTWLKDKATDVPGLLKMDEKKARELFVSAVDHATEGLKEVYEWLSENVKVEVVDPAEVADPNKVAAEMKVAEKRFKDNERNKFMKKNKNVQWDEAEENGLRVGQAQDGVLRVGGRTLRLGKGCKVFMD